MTRPTVSVVIPCYNAERFVADAVASALAQTAPPVEIVCVDDGSTDGTLGVLRCLEADHPVVRVLSGPNGGPSAARNRGLSDAQGEYVQFLDADDLLDPTKLEHQLDLVGERRPDLVVAAYRVCPADGGEATVEDVGEGAWASLVEARFGITSANLWRRAAVAEVGGWDEARLTSEDPELVFRLLRAGASVVRDEACLTTLRRRPDSQWNADYERSRRSWFGLRREIVAYMREAGLLTAARRRRIASVLFSALDALYGQDPRLAVEMHGLFRGLDVGPEVADRSRLYVWAYRLGGFRVAQGVRSAWQGLHHAAGHLSESRPRFLSIRP